MLLTVNELRINSDWGITSAGMWPLLPAPRAAQQLQGLRAQDGVWGSWLWGAGVLCVTQIFHLLYQGGNGDSDKNSFISPIRITSLARPV